MSAEDRLRAAATRLDRLLSGDPRRASIVLFALFLLLFVAVSQPFLNLLIPRVALLLGKADRDLAEWDEPFGGEYVLPSATQDALALLRASGERRYWASPQVLRQRLLVGRLFEASVPILPDAKAKILLFGRSEALPPECRALAERGALRLARCD
jgi:hypothetical protein